jgi:hypothetical protein
MELLFFSIKKRLTTAFRTTTLLLSSTVLVSRDNSNTLTLPPTSTPLLTFWMMATLLDRSWWSAGYAKATLSPHYCSTWHLSHV